MVWIKSGQQNTTIMLSLVKIRDSPTPEEIPPWWETRPSFLRLQFFVLSYRKSLYTHVTSPPTPEKIVLAFKH